ncbi:MAG: hypothetical protein AAGI14_06650 [Pseudomonadota bacterium]
MAEIDPIEYEYTSGTTEIDSNALEVSSKKRSDFLHVWASSNDDLIFTFYTAPKQKVSVTLSELKEIIEEAQSFVKYFGPADEWPEG